MTYHELVEKVRTALVVKADASKIEEHIAVQVNVTGEAEGAFYIEIKDGVLCVEPYTYNDRDFLLTADAEEILAVAQGKKTLETAVTEGTIAHEGNWEKTLTLSGIIPAVKKTSRKPKAEKEEAQAEEPAEGQLAFAEETVEDTVKAEAEKPAEEAPKAEETPKAEEAPKKVGRPKKSTSKTSTKSTSKSKSKSTTKK
ncbi:MAG: SCP2 sterol-binding domain-containing protein [Oscillospiraceae bacterium]|nr:SCP2 sterol-binding domain-containing protein [Oscillospiraceae bacterium]